MDTAFARTARARFETLHDSVRAVLDSLPERVESGGDLKRQLALDHNLSWKIHRLATIKDAGTLASRLPSPVGVRKFTESARGRGVPAPVIEGVTSAYEGVEMLMREYADDREQFEAMLADLAPEEGRKLDLEAKRAAFRANSRLYGLHCDLCVGALILRPNDGDAVLYDIAGVMGTFGLRRIKPSVSLVLSRWRHTVDGESDDGSPRRSEPAREFYVAPFCSDLASIERTRDDGTGLTTETFTSADIGLRSAVDVVSVSVVEGAQPSQSLSGRPEFTRRFQNSRPTRLVMLDLLIHPDIAALPSVETLVFRKIEMEAPLPEPINPEDLLACQEYSRLVGRGVGAGTCKEMPRYGEMLDYVFDELGWPERDRYQLVRCRAEHPVMTSTIVQRLLL